MTPTTARPRRLAIATIALALAAAPARGEEEVWTAVEEPGEPDEESSDLGEESSVRADKLGCLGGEGKACFRLGERARDGDGLPRDDMAAAMYFRGACEASTPDYQGCAYLGRFYAEGRGVARSVEQARNFLRKACMNRAGDSCQRLASLDLPRDSSSEPRSSPPSLRPDVEAWCDPDDVSCAPPLSKRDRELERLTRSCDREEMDDCARLGRMLLEKGPDRDPARAFELFERACNADNGTACGALGLMYARGEDVEGGKDLRKAISLFDRSCELGFPHGCRMLADAYNSGFGRPMDLKRALALANRACEGGCQDGCGLAGIILSDPEFSGYDPALGYALLDRGCTSGDLGSCGFQGLSLMQGRGTQRDPTRALALFRKACDGGELGGCYILGTVLAKSSSLDDRNEARSALDKVCQAGRESGCEARDRMDGSPKRK